MGMEGGIMTAVQTSNPVHDAEGAVEAGIHEVGATIARISTQNNAKATGTYLRKGCGRSYMRCKAIGLAERP